MNKHAKVSLYGPHLLWSCQHPSQLSKWTDASAGRDWEKVMELRKDQEQYLLFFINNKNADTFTGYSLMPLHFMEVERFFTFSNIISCLSSLKIVCSRHGKPVYPSPGVIGLQLPSSLTIRHAGWGWWESRFGSPPLTCTRNSMHNCLHPKYSFLFFT